VFYLGGSDFIESHTLNPLLAPSLVRSDKLEKHYLQKGDVLVLSKGHHGFSAHCYQGDKYPAVASSIFMVLRNIKSSVLPEYLAWYINLRSIQNTLITHSRGSALPAINKKILSELDINVPDLVKQQAIVSLNHLKKKETKLIKKLDSLKAIQLETLLKFKLK
jgi:restriction endonuclease S subunit